MALAFLPVTNVTARASLYSSLVFVRNIIVASPILGMVHLFAFAFYLYDSDGVW